MRIAVRDGYGACSLNSGYRDHDDGRGMTPPETSDKPKDDSENDPCSGKANPAFDRQPIRENHAVRRGYRGGIGQADLA